MDDALLPVSVDGAVLAPVNELLAVDLDGPVALAGVGTGAVAHIDLNDIGPPSSAAIDIRVAGNIAKDEQVVAGIACEVVVS